MSKIIYVRPSGSEIEVADTEGNRQMAKVLEWKKKRKSKESAIIEPKQKQQKELI